MSRLFMGMTYLGKTERDSQPEAPGCSGTCPRFDDCDPESGVCLVKDEAEARAEDEADAKREDEALYGGRP